MALIEINKDPTRRQLLWFGAALVMFFGVVGALARWRFGGPTVGFVLWGVAAVVGLVYYGVRPWRKPIYLGWSYATYPLGWLLSHAVLAITYYLVLTPIGLLMRLFRRDAMGRRCDGQARTYWIERQADRGPAGYFKQF